MPYPILYSLQHCPYAMRARLGLLLAKQQVMLRAIVLKDKPDEMLKASPKGTVPVLVLDKSLVIDESLDIMMWALRRNDPQNLLRSDEPEIQSAMFTLINNNDVEFINWLEKYKLAKRRHDMTEIFFRQQCEIFVQQLEQRLTEHKYFMGNEPSLADYAILPYIRQFARVDRKWYLQAPYPNLRNWLNTHFQNPLFTKAMAKFPLYLDNSEEFLFGMGVVEFLD